MSDNLKHLSLRISKELHMQLKMKLLKEEKSFQGWVEQQIKDYVEWEEDQD